MLLCLAVTLIDSPLSAQTKSKSKTTKKTTTTKSEKAATDTPAALNFTMKSITGEDMDLSKYKGNVVLLVTVASKCGRTPQYEQLQALHKQYADQGLSIIGVPCNQFGGQEPGTDSEIAEFCQENYNVQFEMLSKVNVKDKTKCELYKHLTALELGPVGAGEVAWNFEKFIIDRSGKPIARYGSKVKPDNKEIVGAIEKALAATVGGHYSHVSKKSGKTYYLFKKDVPLKNSTKVQTIYYFAKDPNNPKGEALAEVPEGKVVSETRTGMLVLKKKK